LHLTFLQDFTPTESTDYSLWKATKKTKLVKKPSPPLKASQGTWARSDDDKAHAFSEHLAKVFQSHPSENKFEKEALTLVLKIPHQAAVSKELKFKKLSTA
jgi:hypothetical protein